MGDYPSVGYPPVVGLSLCQLYTCFLPTLNLPHDNPKPSLNLFVGPTTGSANPEAGVRIELVFGAASRDGDCIGLNETDR